LSALAAAYPKMNVEEREHVTMFFYRHTKKFEIRSFESGSDWGDIQMAIDSPEDLKLADRMAIRLGKEGVDCGLDRLIGIRAELMEEIL
jgi:spore coat polysaccharide biosynthesis protein SpsF (cytidylyltransferase family)